MKHRLSQFSVQIRGKKVLVSRKPTVAGNYYSLHYNNREINLKGEGVRSILWIEKGKGATSLASELGKQIEASLQLPDTLIS